MTDEEKLNLIKQRFPKIISRLNREAAARTTIRAVFRKARNFLPTPSVTTWPAMPDSILNITKAKPAK